MTTKKTKRGRPTDYREEHNELVRKLCLLGATDKEIAECLNVAESTLNLWKNKYPAFSEALKDGRERADARVGERLYQRAMGYSHPEEKIFNHNGKEMRIETTKHYPPDTVACIFWLKNRQKDRWRDVKDHKHSGKVEHEMNYSDAERINRIAWLVEQQGLDGLRSALGVGDTDMGTAAGSADGSTKH